MPDPILIAQHGDLACHGGLVRETHRQRSPRIAKHAAAKPCQHAEREVGRLARGLGAAQLEVFAQDHVATVPVTMQHQRRIDARAELLKRVQGPAQAGLVGNQQTGGTKVRKRAAFRP